MTRLLRSCRTELGSFVYCHIPWANPRGYVAYKNAYITRILDDEHLRRRLRQGEQIPAGFGLRLDERVIEYPWVLAKLENFQSPCIFLDAGSALNHQMILDHPLAKPHRWTIVGLAPESNCLWDRGISYVFDDLRRMCFREASFDGIFCISVLEHVGMDNALYVGGNLYREDRPHDYLLAIAEMRRVLSQGGWLYITVPFGAYENHGWLQQFDSTMLSRIIAQFGPRDLRKTFFTYSDRGWRLCSEAECSVAQYSDIRKFVTGTAPKDRVGDFAPTASAVACVELQK